MHVVAVSHLDTQWRWTIRDTIESHLPATLAENFRRFREFPNYVVAFDGSFRYRLIEETSPEAFEELRRWVRAGRWTIAGAFVDAADVNLPNPESLVRHVLLATRYYRERFGLRPRDVFLPDCFGFGAALPTVASHCGLIGFSSQKLGRGRSSRPLPFALGVWQGVDGSELVASLDPGGYGEMLRCDLMRSLGGVAEGAVVQRYFGVGDTGGAPGAESLAWLERSIAAQDGIEVRVGPSSRLFDDLGETERAELPRHRGELLMRLHGPGCYTSVAAMKGWNRRNERMARTAEAMAVVAHRVAGTPYPRRKLNEAWERFLAHQFHDDLTGTSVPKAYDFSLRDEALSQAAFGDVLQSRFAAVAGQLDTATKGKPLVVFNPLAVDRTDLVEFELEREPSVRTPVAVRGPDGVLTRCQELNRQGRRSQWTFPASVAGFAVAVFEILEIDAPTAGGEPPLANEASTLHLSNAECRLTVDEQGRIASFRWCDREYLGRPIELELLPDRSRRFPAWEIRYEDVTARPRELVSGPARTEVENAGPWLQRLRVERAVGRSRFVDHLELAHGFPGLRVRSEVDWQARGRLLKLAVSTAWADAEATYGLGWGAIERGVNSEQSYEVPAQQWAHLRSNGCEFGLGLLAQDKYGWDRPARSTLRMTWLHTPSVGRRFRFQGRQDLGKHEIRWALVPHSGTWNDLALPEIAERFENPLLAMAVERHAGRLGRSHRWLEIEGPGVLVTALKLAEDGRGAILRLRESRDRPAHVVVRLDAAVVSAEEVDGAEEAHPEGSAGGVEFSCHSISTELRPFAVSALRIQTASDRVEGRAWTCLRLPLNSRLTAERGDRRASGFDRQGYAFLADLFPCGDFEDGGILFDLAPRGEPNAWTVERGTVELSGEVGRVAFLLTAPRPTEVRFSWRGESTIATTRVPGWRDSQVRSAAAERLESPLPIAWVSRHLTRRGKLAAYEFGYLFRLELERPGAARVLELSASGPVALLSAATMNAAPVEARPPVTWTTCRD